MKFALEGDRCALASLAKLTVGCMCFLMFWCIFRAFGVHFVGPGAPLASFWPLGAPRPIQDLILSLFFRLLDNFWPALAAQGAPNGPQGAQRRPKWCPKCSLRGPKVTPKVDFVEIRETLIFDDSIMKIIGFWCPGRSLGRPKRCRKPGK